MIYNLSTILREIYNNNGNNGKNKTNKPNKNIIVSTPNSFEKKNMVNPHYNLKINAELANQKSLELYEKYNTYRRDRAVGFFPIIKSNLYTDTRFAFYIKNVLVIGCFFMLLACFPHYSYSYTYFKK
jgi:hypothetical protein